jgi:hypothetical protein
MTILTPAKSASASAVTPVRGQTPNIARFPLSTNTSGDDQNVGRQEGELRVPLMISSEQEYYWTKAWQEGELEALDEINAGESHVFTHPEDAIRWLLSEEE